MQNTNYSSNKNSLERLNSSKSVKGRAGAVETLITECGSEEDDKELERSLKTNKWYKFVKENANFNLVHNHQKSYERIHPLKSVNLCFKM